MKKNFLHVLMAIAILILFLNACKSAAATPTPTSESLEAIASEAAQTAFVQLTQLALTVAPTATNTNTPVMTPTFTPTLSTPTLPQPTVASCGGLTLLKDVTIPDYTEMAAGDKFTKTWRVKNTGTCTWTTSFMLVFLYGESMGGKPVYLADSVAVGDWVDISIKMVVPDKTGKLTGVWGLVDDQGRSFGELIAVRIIVGEASSTPTETLTETGTPTEGTPTETPTPTDTRTPKPTKTPTPTKTPKS